MSDARVTILPSRPAVRSDAACTLDLLVTIAPPAATPTAGRPALNLGLVLDRSGSMGESRKLGFAKEAAVFAVRELGATDRASVTVFDDRIETIVPNGVPDKARVAALIEAVTPRGSTALHGGWAEGAAQVKSGLVAGGLNRVLLLSDGLANVGESRPDAIANDVHSRTRDGVSTSTIGLGSDYNEDLLEAMARAGDGNYYYVESPAQLAALFVAELQGLTATVGTDVTLAVESAPGVVSAEVLNELDTTPDGKYRLPNLVSGMPVYVVVRVTVPGGEGEVPVARFRVEWTSANGDGRRVAVAGLTLPAVPSAVWDALPENPEVRTQAGLLLAARAKKAATRASEAGDRVGTMAYLACAREELNASPMSADVLEDIEALDKLDALNNEDEGKFRKQAKFESYQRHRNKPYRPDQPEQK